MAPEDTQYSVAVFYDNGKNEYVCRFVDVKEALITFSRMCRCVGARVGMVKRVIITDGGDCTNAEWTYGKGITFPPTQDERSIH